MPSLPPLQADRPLAPLIAEQAHRFRGEVREREPVEHVGSRPQCFQFVGVEAVRVGCCQRRARLDQRLAPRHREQEPQHRQWRSLLRRVGLQVDA